MWSLSKVLNKDLKKKIVLLQCKLLDMIFISLNMASKLLEHVLYFQRSNLVIIRNNEGLSYLYTMLDKIKNIKNHFHFLSNKLIKHTMKIWVSCIVLSLSSPCRVQKYPITYLNSFCPLYLHECYIFIYSLLHSDIYIFLFTEFSPLLVRHKVSYTRNKYFWIILAKKIFTNWLIIIRKLHQFLIYLWNKEHKIQAFKLYIFVFV